MRYSSFVSVINVNLHKLFSQGDIWPVKAEIAVETIKISDVDQIVAL